MIPLWKTDSLLPRSFCMCDIISVQPDINHITRIFVCCRLLAEISDRQESSLLMISF